MIGEALPVVRCGLGVSGCGMCINGSGRWHFSALTLNAFRRSQACHGCMASSTIFLSVMRPSKSVLVIAAVLLTAVLAYFGTGLNPFWPLLWFAPVPVLVVATGLRPFHAFLVALLAWLGGIEPVDLFHAGPRDPAPDRHSIFPYSRSSVWPGCSLHPQFSSPPIANPRDARFSRLHWVTWEYLSSVTSPHSTFGNLGYTQMGCLPLIQVASITGIWALSFVVFLFAAAVASLLSGAGKSSRRGALAPWSRRNPLHRHYLR